MSNRRTVAAGVRKGLRPGHSVPPGTDDAKLLKKVNAPDAEPPTQPRKKKGGK